MTNKGKHFYGYARTVEIGVGSASAGSATDVPIWVAPFRRKVKSIHFVPQSSITGDATNYMTISVINKGSDGSKNITIASKAFTSGSYSAYAPISISANKQVKEGEVLQFKKEESGTGMNMPDMVAIVEYLRD